MRQLFGLIMLFLSCIALTAAPVPKEKPVVKDEDGIIGTWAVDKFDGGDAKPPAEERLKSIRFVFKKDNKLDFIRGVAKDKSGTFTIDPAKKPKQIDLVTSDWRTLGIYELDGDTLKLCFPDRPEGTRPTEMKPDVSTKTAVVTFKRTKADDLPAKPAEAKEAAKPPVAAGEKK